MANANNRYHCVLLSLKLRSALTFLPVEFACMCSIEWSEKNNFLSKFKADSSCFSSFAWHIDYKIPPISRKCILALNINRDKIDFIILTMQTVPKWYSWKMIKRKKMISYIWSQELQIFRKKKTISTRFTWKVHESKWKLCGSTVIPPDGMNTHMRRTKEVVLKFYLSWFITKILPSPAAFLDIAAGGNFAVVNLSYE